MATIKLPGRSILDMDNRKIIGVPNGTEDTDAVNYSQIKDLGQGEVTLAQFGGSNVWQESVELAYVTGQTVTDFRVQLQGNVTTGLITHVDNANDYQLPGGATALVRPSDQTLQDYLDRFVINSVGDVDTLTVTNVVIASDGVTTITLSGTGATVDFTVTYPPSNFGSIIGATTREYSRRATPAPVTPTDAQKLELRPITAEFSFDADLGVNVSDYWIQILINGSAWRLHQDYIEGDEVEYVDSQGVPRHVFCKVPHTSSEATNPDLASAVSHTGTGFSAATTPWEPVGGSIDLSTGTSATPVQLMQDETTQGTFVPAVIFGIAESTNPNDPQTWSLIVGDGIGGTAELEGDNLPLVNDLISFGTGNTGTSEEYRVTQVSGGTITTITFNGRIPSDVRSLFDTGNLVHIFDAGMRTDLGQIDRLVFDPEDFVINTEAQNIGHAHISITGKQDSLPPLHYGGVWTNGGTTSNPVYASEVIDIIGIIGDQHVDHTFANIGAWQADTDTNFEVGQYVALTSSSTARYKITTASVGYSATGFTEFAVGDEDVENLILATASDISRAGGRFPTTEAWQNNRFALKGESGGGVDVEATFPTNAALGHQIFLDPAGNNVTVVDDDGHRRPRGFYSYIQPLSNPNSRYWEQITIPEVPELYNSAREGDLIYLTDAEEDFNTGGNNFDAGFYRAGPTSANAQTWIATGGTTGNSVEVNGIRVHNANFSSHTEAATYLYSPPFQSDENTTTGDTDVSIQVDTREIGNALGINSLRAQVHQIEEELSQPGEYTWVDEQVFVDVFITNRVNSSGTLNQTTILQPHFTDNSNIFTTYALLTGDDDTGLRNQWNGFNSNAEGIIVGLGPDDTDLVAFQLLSTYYRDSTAAGLAEIRLKMIDPDGAFAGPSQAGTNTNKQQFISWISDNDNPITTADPNPVIHQGISTYYYETDNDFLDTVRHNVGSHIEGSALTADERVIVDNLLVPMADQVVGTAPGGDNVTTLDTYDTAGGSVPENGWYWRNAYNAGTPVTGADITSWADLITDSTVTNFDPNTYRVLMVRKNNEPTGLDGILTGIDADLLGAGGGNNLEPGDLDGITPGDFYVSDGTINNFAHFRVWTFPAIALGDVRFILHELVDFQGVPPLTGALTISDVEVDVTEPVRSGNPSFQESLDITGDLNVGGAINDGNSTAMAYVAIQFTSIFTEIRTSILDGGLTSPDVPANYTYIEYTAEFSGARVTMIDRVASTGATITRRFTTATPADFNTGIEVEQS